MAVVSCHLSLIMLVHSGLANPLLVDASAVSLKNGRLINNKCNEPYSSFRRCNKTCFFKSEIYCEKRKEKNEMRFIRNCIMMLAVLGVVGLGCSMKVEACSNTSGCYSTTKNIQCGINVSAMVSSTHVVRENNGYTETCTIRTISADHKITCSGCGYVYTSSERRTCSTIHSYSYCVPKYGQCQYQ